MNYFRFFLRLGGVLSVALATGHWVQGKSRSSSAEPPELSHIELVAARPDHANSLSAAPLPAADPAPEPVSAAIGPLPAAAAPAEERAAAPIRDCQPSLSLSPRPGAMIAVSLTAPCDGLASVILTHGPLNVSLRLDPEGRRSLSLPALDERGRVSATFADARTLSGAAPVSDLAAWQRQALQFSVKDSFSLRALDSGRRYSTLADLSPEQDPAPQRGQMLLLGDAGAEPLIQAQVYTFPTGAPFTIETLIEAPVTHSNCGRMQSAEVISLSQGQLVHEILSLTMPDCMALGDILVLKNPFPERTLATAD